MSDPNHDQFILKAVLASLASGVKIPAIPCVRLALADQDWPTTGPNWPDGLVRILPVRR